MPNYANVVITVKAETQKEIDDFLSSGKIAQDGVSIIADSYYPIPDDDVEKRKQLWGTKFIWDFDVIRVSETEVNLETCTAWSAPLGYVEYVSKQFPNLSFELICDEPGCGVNEWVVFQNGEKTDLIDDFIDDLVSFFFEESYPFIEIEKGKPLDYSKPFYNFIREGRFNVTYSPSENWELFLEYLEESEEEEDDND